jgi:hypothetical protein
MKGKNGGTTRVAALTVLPDTSKAENVEQWRGQREGVGETEAEAEIGGDVELLDLDNAEKYEGVGRA